MMEFGFSGNVTKGSWQSVGPRKLRVKHLFQKCLGIHHASTEIYWHSGIRKQKSPFQSRSNVQKISSGAGPMRSLLLIKAKPNSS